MLQKLENLIFILKNFDSQILQPVFKDVEIQELLTDAIKRKLIQRGETVEGQKIITNSGLRQNTGSYSKYTQKLKREKGQETDFVTFKDTGNFFKSIEIQAKTDFFKVLANTEKDNGLIYKNFTSMFASEEEFNFEILQPAKRDLLVIKSLILNRIGKEIRNKIS